MFPQSRYSVGLQFINSLSKKAGSRWLRHRTGLLNFSQAGPYDLVWPATFEVKDNGKALKIALEESTLEIDQVVVATYSPTLEFGKVEYDNKAYRGTGHKALENFFEHVKTDHFPRLYIGVYHPPGRGYIPNALMSHNLSTEEYFDFFLANRFNEEEQIALEKFIIPNAARALERQESESLVQYEYSEIMKMVEKTQLEDKMFSEYSKIKSSPSS